MKHSISFRFALLAGLILLGTLIGNGLVLYGVAHLLPVEGAEADEARLSLPRRERMRMLSTLLVIVSIHTVFVGCMALIGYIALSRLVLTPIRNLTAHTRKVATGHFTHSIEVPSDSELKELAHAITSLTNRVHTAVATFQRHCQDIQDSASDMTHLADEQGTGHHTQFKTLSRMRHALEDMAGSTEHVLSKTSRMRHEIVSTRDSTRHIEETLDQTLHSMKELREHVGKNTERVMLLGEKISQITNVVKMINTIADQTKLIAFNTSIEAAGAGEAGGRFSVVATEIRRLANTVVESLGDIRLSVSSIQSATSDLILSSETGIRKVQQGTELIAGIGDSLHGIMTRLDTTIRTADEIIDVVQQEQAHKNMLVENTNDLSSHVEEEAERQTRIREMLHTLNEQAEELDRTLQSRQAQQPAADE